MLAAALSLSSSRIFSRTIVKSTTTTSSFFPRSAPRLAIRSMADSAAAAASAPFTKVRIQREDTAFDAYVVGKDNAPGIVVLQEWWGVDFEIKNHALKISQMDPGFKALIPDLYRGKVGLDVAEAQHLMDGLDWAGAVKDIRASANWLKANGSKKVGVTGSAWEVLFPLPVLFWSLRLIVWLPSMVCLLPSLLIPPRLRLLCRLILGSLIILLAFQM
ncbi:hypothetical protein BT93_L4671 [Corymbia citriodora subsp. variegata]|uniref:Dienelactone hydrolase domain-containing protein n=1 Tax=Corymbia citriodora subsp. variegata TaxID=360336 RepID=A0A8T0CTU2_CORYI|nr:hypothetical protein BT93_L4671 [Corymbia citriodora subsp. variegata]